MVRKKDSFWEYVEPLNGRFKCKFCERDFAGGAPRIKSHLSGVKGRDIDICAKVPDDVQAKAYLEIHGSNKKSKYVSNSNEVHGLTSGSLSKGVQNYTIPGMLKNKDKDRVDKSVTKCFILNNMTFNIIQTNSFKEMCSDITHYVPSYKLPSFSTLRTKLVPGAKCNINEYISSVKKSWVNSGCTILSDSWSYLLQRSFINIVAYSPSGAVFKKTADLSSERHTGIKIKELLSSVIDEIGPEYVVQVVINNGKNFLLAGEMLIGKYPHLYKTRCVAHGIQLILKDIYQQVEFVHDIINNCKTMRDYLYRRTIVLSLMRKHTNNKEFKRPCATRFASNFKMLESILDVENALRMLVACTEWRGISFSKSLAARNTSDIIQRESFWKEGKEVKMILEPIVRILRLVDGEGSTSAYLYEAVEREREGIKQISDENLTRYARILQLFEIRRKENIVNEVHAAAAFLNPAFFYGDKFKETREMKLGINYMEDNLVAEEDKNDFLKEVQMYRVKRQSIFNSTAITMLQTSHPRIWWDFYGDSLPILQKHVIRILSQPCSSSACERHWSAFEASQTKKRNRLKPEMLDNLVYVRMNTIAMEKYGELEAQDLEPISLDNLPELPDYVDAGEEPMDPNDNFEDDILHDNFEDDILSFDDDTDFLDE